MNGLTVAQRTELARKRVCPECHAEAGDRCKSMPLNSRSFRPVMPVKLMKGIHARRLALVPRQAGE